MRTKRTISRTCLHCGSQFSVEPYKVREGKAKYCSRTCRGLASRRGEMTACAQCSTAFYLDAAKAKAGRKLCSRQCYVTYSTGENHHAWKGGPSHIGSHGYRQFSDGTLEHRRILLAQIGPGVHPCHWCEIPVEWLDGAKTAPGALVVDHVDEDKTNNAPSNLVPSCCRCNARRSSRTLVRDDEVFVIDTLGRRQRAVLKPCEHCQLPFLARANQVRQGKGRFCSRTCARAHPWAIGAAWTTTALNTLALGRKRG